MSPSHVRVRTRALALLAAFVLTTPSALAEPRTPEAISVAPVVIPNTVPLAVARPPAPIRLVESGGGFVAAGGISARREPTTRKFPGTATELATQRTEFSTGVANPDGTFTETLALGRLNYKDAKGAWQPIDVKLVTRAIDTYSLGMAANDVDLRLSPVLGADRMVELAAGDYRVRIRVPGLATGTISTSADRLAFSGVGTDPGFEIIPTPEGFEFRAILADATTSSEVRVALQTVGLTPSIRPDGTIDLADPAGKPIGRISAPAVIDAAGEFAPADAVTTTLLDRKAGDPIRDSLPAVDPANLAGSAGLAPADNVLRADEVVVAYAIDPVWLAAKERVYPVVLDPSVCVAYGTGTGCTGPSGTRDVWISKGQPDLSPTVGPLRAGYDGATYSTTRSEIYFPDVALTDGAVVTSATLQVVTTGNYSNRTLKVAPLTQPWPFGNGTWNNQPTHDATAELAFTPPAVSGGSTMTMDISPIVRSWYSRNPVTWKANSGVKLYLADESTSCTSTQACYRISFYALDGTATQRPKLTINYLVHQARVDFDASLGTDFAPATMPASGTISLPVTVNYAGSGFTFNACAGATTNCYKVGYRWFDSMGKLAGTIGPANVTDLPASLTSGTTSATIKLDVVAPATAGQYSLRTDLVWMWNGSYVFASDYADPSKYFARAKDPLATASNVRWVGTSVLARGDYPIAVVAGGGTGVGETKSVSLPDGSALGVNLWSRNLRFDGSGGVGFGDLGTALGLTWYYDSAFRTDCTSSVLGACGWGTNYDEGFLPGVNGADWIYRDPDGNRFAVDESADGQLVSGAGVRLDRYRATLIEDNNLTGWTGGPVSRSTTEHYAGAASISIATNGGYSLTYGFRPVDVSHFILGSFAAKATGATGVGIGFHVKNDSTGSAGWLYYTLGTDFVISGVTSAADRLTGITPTTGAAATLSLDALGRHRTRVAGGITETYTYAGESQAIVRISPSSGTTTNSVVDATGARLAVSTSTSGFGWTLADLHGDIAGYAASSGAVVTDATRYDPYGEVVAATSSGLGSPWGYQGRLDLAAPADTDLLDFGFRPYAPDLGTFTNPDDQAGSALNPLTFNRYLYAGANPETLVDPGGHWPWDNINPLDVIGTVASVHGRIGCLWRGGRPGNSGDCDHQRSGLHRGQRRVTAERPRP